MKRSRFTEVQIIGISKKQETEHRIERNRIVKPPTSISLTH